MTRLRTRAGTKRAVCRVAVGSDHGGYALKEHIVRWVQALGCEVADMGTHSTVACDYPKVAEKVALAVADAGFSRGVLVCRSGIGMAMVANKVAGIRAGVCGDLHDAEHSRKHNDANVLVLGADKLSVPKAKKIVKLWFDTKFEGGRHARRVRQMSAIERRTREKQ